MGCSTKNSDCQEGLCVCNEGYCGKDCGKGGCKTCERDSDWTCNIDTGGTCAYFGCDKSRGEVACKFGLCMCKEGYCSDSKGKCVSKAENDKGPTMDLSAPIDPLANVYPVAAAAGAALLGLTLAIVALRRRTYDATAGGDEATGSAATPYKHLLEN